MIAYINVTVTNSPDPIVTWRTLSCTHEGRPSPDSHSPKNYSSIPWPFLQDQPWQGFDGYSASRQQSSRSRCTVHSWIGLVIAMGTGIWVTVAVKPKHLSLWLPCRLARPRTVTNRALAEKFLWLFGTFRKSPYICKRKSCRNNYESSIQTRKRIYV